MSVCPHGGGGSLSHDSLGQVGRNPTSGGKDQSYGCRKVMFPVMYICLQVVLIPGCTGTAPAERKTRVHPILCLGSWDRNGGVDIRRWTEGFLVVVVAAIIFVV